MDAYAGKDVVGVSLISDLYTPAGWWFMYMSDFSYVGADGTVFPIYTGEGSIGGSMWGSSGVTNRSFGAQHDTGQGQYPQYTTTYYHEDHLGTSRLLTNYLGYPTWQGTFLPFGQEWNPQITTNHYKFTGKERDAESSLDYFGARYYSSTMGRWMSPDWADKPEAVPYADLGDPQSLNLYGYVRNNPMSRADADGHADNGVGEPCGNGAPCLSVAQTFHDLPADMKCICADSKKSQFAGSTHVNETELMRHMAETFQGMALMFGMGEMIPELGPEGDIGDSLKPEVGEFSIIDWTGYPESAPRPPRTIRIIEGEEYTSARAAADAKNKALHRADPALNNQHIHEVKPVKFGGSPTAMANKIAVSPPLHYKLNNFWRAIQDWVEKHPSSPAL